VLTKSVVSSITHIHLIQQSDSTVTCSSSSEPTLASSGSSPSLTGTSIPYRNLQNAISRHYSLSELQYPGYPAILWPRASHCRPPIPLGDLHLDDRGHCELKELSCRRISPALSTRTRPDQHCLEPLLAMEANSNHVPSFRRKHRKLKLLRAD
jgi:hypothetical protein